MKNDIVGYRRTVLPFYNCWKPVLLKTIGLDTSFQTLKTRPTQRKRCERLQNAVPCTSER